jgi:hypothetical protein
VLPRYCRSHRTGQRLGVAAPFSSQNVIAALGSHRRRKESRYERNRRQQSEPSPEQGCNLQSSGVALAKLLHEKDNPDKLALFHATNEVTYEGTTAPAVKQAFSAMI